MQVFNLIIYWIMSFSVVGVSNEVHILFKAHFTPSYLITVRFDYNKEKEQNDKQSQSIQRYTPLQFLSDTSS